MRPFEHKHPIITDFQGKDWYVIDYRLPRTGEHYLFFDSGIFRNEQAYTDLRPIVGWERDFIVQRYYHWRVCRESHILQKVPKRRIRK